MSVMSDLHLHASEVQDQLEGGVDLHEAIQTVATQSAYDYDDIEYAYRQRFGDEPVHE